MCKRQDADSEEEQPTSLLQQEDEILQCHPGMEWVHGEWSLMRHRVVGDVEKRYSSFHVDLTIRTLFFVNWSLTFRLRSK